MDVFDLIYSLVLELSARFVPSGVAISAENKLTMGSREKLEDIRREHLDKLGVSGIPEIIIKSECITPSSGEGSKVRLLTQVVDVARKSATL